MDTIRRAAVFIETQGCKLNQADTQALTAQFLSAGYALAETPERANVCVVNTCTITHEADAKARQALRGARRRNPRALVVATGCYAQRAPGQLAQLGQVDLVLGNTEKDTLVARVSEASGSAVTPCSAGDAAVVETSSLRVRGMDEGALPVAPMRTRAMVKIQEGCDQVCAYCIVPKVRGRERSIHPDALVGRVQRLVDEGYKEVTLTGTQLGTYGFDMPGASLAGLIARVLAETKVARLRVSSLQAQEITQDLLALWQDPRLCPHFHLPLQSGSAQVLEHMRRRYTPAKYARAVELVRSRVPGAAVTADVIAGFPGETQERFEETYRFCEGIGFAALHVFPYSVRPGTSAAHVDGQVEDAAKRERVARLLAQGKAQTARFQKGLAGSVRPVLWETSRLLGVDRVWSGLTDNYVRVSVAFGMSLRNQITPVLLERRQGDTLWGRLADP